jgi:hypothetical protein
VPQCVFEKSGAMKTVTVDGSALSFQGGKATRTLKPGEYAVHWFARGDKGDEYSLKITKPPSAVREMKGKIDSSGKEAETLWLRVSA